MDKKINHLINQLHLDPKREAAVRKIVNEVTKFSTAPDNNNGGGDVYSIRFDEFKTSEDFDNLYNAFKQKKIIIIDGALVIMGTGTSDGKPMLQGFVSMIQGSYSGSGETFMLTCISLTFLYDGRSSSNMQCIELQKGYGGDKYLSNDGTYKSI